MIVLFLMTLTKKVMYFIPFHTSFSQSYNIKKNLYVMLGNLEMEVYKIMGIRYSALKRFIMIVLVILMTNLMTLITFMIALVKEFSVF